MPRPIRRSPIPLYSQVKELLRYGLTPETEAELRARAAATPAGLPLSGRSFAVKDNIDVAGMPTTAACPMRPKRTIWSPWWAARIDLGSHRNGATPCPGGPTPAPLSNVVLRYTFGRSPFDLAVETWAAAHVFS